MTTLAKSIIALLLVSNLGFLTYFFDLHRKKSDVFNGDRPEYAYLFPGIEYLGTEGLSVHDMLRYSYVFLPEDPRRTLEAFSRDHCREVFGVPLAKDQPLDLEPFRGLPILVHEHETVPDGGVILKRVEIDQFALKNLSDLRAACGAGSP